MERVQLAHAKAHLLALLERGEAGEEIVIARRGKVIARPVPERPDDRTAADALHDVWALGGFDFPEIVEPQAGLGDVRMD